jgi:hypothetical protein
MINRLVPVADAEAVDQRGRLLIAGYAVKRLSASLSPRDRRESGRAVPRGAHRARSALSASTRESDAAARAARETPGLLGRNGEAPSDRSLGASVYRPSPLVGDERKMAPHGGACTKPIGFTSRERAEVSRLGDRGVAESAEERPTARGCIGAPGRAGERGKSRKGRGASSPPRPRSGPPRSQPAAATWAPTLARGAPGPPRTPDAVRGQSMGGALCGRGCAILCRNVASTVTEGSREIPLNLSDPLAAARSELGAGILRGDRM